MCGPQCGESELAGAPLHEIRRWVYRQGCRQPETVRECCLIQGRGRALGLTRTACPLQSHVPAGGVAGVLWVPAPPPQPSFSSGREDGLASFPDRQSLLPAALFHPTPVHPKAPPGPEVRSTMPARASFIRTATSGPWATWRPCPTWGSPPSGTPPARGEVSRATAGLEEQAGVWGRPCARSPIWCGAGPEGGVVLPDGHVALPSAQGQRGSRRQPWPSCLPCRLHPGTQGRPVRSSSCPAQAHGPWRLGCVSVLLLRSSCGQTVIPLVEASFS